jgi:miniconductance mechanosensitive channel
LISAPIAAEEVTVKESRSAGLWLIDFIQETLRDMGVGESIAPMVSHGIVVLFILILCLAAYLITRTVLMRSISYVAQRSKTQWDDLIMEHKVFSRLAWLAPALVVYLFAAAFPEGWKDYVQRIMGAYMILVSVLVLNALLNAAMAIYRTTEASGTRPIKSFIDLAKILIFIIGGVMILCALMKTSPWVFLSGIGAMTAVLLIVFKDSLLGLVASFQITSLDMVRNGDWIAMPKYGADGDVIEVSLHTVKVRNWDKTITTIPTYALVSESFKNWRGMSESGGRRIKRAIHIDMNSIKFCDAEMLERFRKFELIKDYVEEKAKEVDTYNQEQGIDTSELINGRRLTNVGTFRAYIAAYLENHPEIHQGMTFLVRQLAPGEHGLPIEVYVFSRIQAWAAYEAVQADIFDHILAVVPRFDLRVFQRPSGNDFRAWQEGSKAV